MEVYVPHAQSGGDYLTLVVRGEGGRTPDLAALEEVVREADPGLALIRPATLREVVNREMVAPKFYTSLLAAFAGLAVLLTAIGLYGVVAFRVSSRRREIGIRMAVGGEAWRIVRQILWGALTPAALGVLAGLLAALALTRLLGGLLYNVRPHDPITWVGVTFLVLAIVILASSLPASRASRVAPSEVLREE
jgi:di/tricarboxylate transporter